MRLVEMTTLWLYNGSIMEFSIMVVRFLLVMACFVCGVSRADDDPRERLLVEPATLAKPVGNTVPIILDVRAKARYQQGHVPGAIHLDAALWAKEFRDGSDQDGWSKRIGALGISAASRLVIYDDNHAKDAARIWWILRYWGVQDVRLLNGGWIGWERGKHLQDQIEPQISAKAFQATPAVERLRTQTQLLQDVAGGKRQIVDARSEGEYCGTEALTNKRAGAIPGAKPLEWINLIDKESHRFKSTEDLKSIFKAAGIAVDQPTVTYCQSGGRASVMVVGLELVGAKDVRNYYASWAEWGNSDETPVIQPKMK